MPRGIEETTANKVVAALSDSRFDAHAFAYEIDRATLSNHGAQKKLIATFFYLLKFWAIDRKRGLDDGPGPVIGSTYAEILERDEPEILTW